MASNLQALYRCVIEDVITNVRGEFEDMGVDVRILDKLHSLWYQKINSTRASNFAPEDGGFDGDEVEYEPQPSTLQYPTTAADHAVAASLASLASAGIKPDPDLAYTNAGKPQPFLPSDRIAVPGRGNISQTDGASDLTPGEIDSLIEKTLQSHEIVFELPQELSKGSVARHDRGVYQVDGNDDDEDEGGQGDESINSDLDDPDEGNQDSSEENSSDIILCLYDKVSRAKNKWKCSLKDGMMSIGGHDYAFNKASGDFEW